MPKSHRSNEKKIYKARNLDLPQRHSSDETNNNMDQKDTPEKLKSLWKLPIEQQRQLLYKLIIENMFLGNWSLDKSAFRESIFANLELLLDGGTKHSGVSQSGQLRQSIVPDWSWFWDTLQAKIRPRFK